MVNKTNKKEIIDSALLAVLLFFPALNYYFAESLYSFGMKNPLVQVIYFFVYVCGCICYARYFANAFKYILVTLFALMVSFLLTPGVFEAITGPLFLQSLLCTFALVYIPIFLIVSNKSFNFETTFCYLYPIALMVVTICIVTYGIEVMTMSMLHEYMTFAYTGLPAILITLYISTRKRHVLGMIISIIGSATIVFGGCRGALLTMIVFIGLMMLQNLKSSSNRYIIAGLILLFVFNAETIMSFINDFLGSFGYESRIMTLFENEEAAESEGREAVYQKAFTLLDFIGHGVFSDRVLLEHVVDATYCHNWVIEFLVDYGYFIGGILVLLLLRVLIRFVVNRNQLSETGLFMLYFSICMLSTKYMLSGSYLASAEWSLILGWFTNSRTTLKSIIHE